MGPMRRVAHGQLCAFGLASGGAEYSDGAKMRFYEAAAEFYDSGVYDMLRDTKTRAVRRCITTTTAATTTTTSSTNATTNNARSSRCSFSSCSSVSASTGISLARSVFLRRLHCAASKP